MCLVVWAWQVSAATPLVLVGHRDEFHARATAPMAWWRAPRLLGGRDLEAGGTWLGVDDRGRYGIITNLRGAAVPAGAPSRGTLIPRFLGGDAAPGAFAAAVAAEAERYAGFSLLLGDRRELWYVSNGDAALARQLPPGLYGLSNAPLGVDWPKVRQARQRLAARLAAPVEDPEALLALLDDRAPAVDAELPDTGIDLDTERRLSASFIVDPRYGTRAATALVLDAGGGGQVVERSHGPDGAATGTRRFRLDPDGG